MEGIAMSIPASDRPTAAELAAAGGRGIQCPKCHCRHCPESRLPVLRTYHAGHKNSIRRERKCRHCGHTFSTYERTAS